MSELKKSQTICVNRSNLLSAGTVGRREEVAAERELSAVRRSDDGVRELRAGVALVSGEHDAPAGVGAQLLHFAIVQQEEYGRHVCPLEDNVRGYP